LDPTLGTIILQKNQKEREVMQLVNGRVGIGTPVFQFKGTCAESLDYTASWAVPQAVTSI